MAGGKSSAESRGDRLRKLRKAKGLKLEEVSRRTKIHIRILRALESDAVADMAPAYVKGLLKIYCALLGVNPKDFLEVYTKDEPKKPQLPDFPKIQTRIALIRPRVNLSLIKKRIRLRPLALVICLLALAIIAFKLGRGLYIGQGKLRSSKPALVQKDIPQTQVALPAAVSGRPRLDIRAKEDCWLQVKVDDKTVFKDVLKKGRFEYWQAKKEIELSLGNAGGVDVEVNGKMLPPLGRRGQVIKNIKITKEGLTVPE
jgi:cytoskeletal protein RodZ